MGRKITQTIHTCDICARTPDDGEILYQMGSEIWCIECCKEMENE